ncbi:hypothetical protein PG989_002314 [Apiospora arundinis]
MAGERPYIKLPPQQHGLPQHHGPPQQLGPPPVQRPMPPMPPPMPPPEAIPLDLRFNRPAVEMTDVRESFMTPADLMAKCTEYMAYRFDKCDSNSSSNNSQLLDHDAEDATGSRWSQAIRTRIQDLTQQDMAKEVRRLNLQTRHVLDKKRGLVPVLQRQLDSTINELARSEHDPTHYQWTLAQIDHNLQPIDPEPPQIPQS